MANDQQAPSLAASPVINVWYENALRYGQFGNPQRQINILGNVYDPDGSISSLSYRLNNASAVTLRVGPDGYRLANPGDFNIALNTTALESGTNRVIITATDNSGDIASKTVDFTYTPNRTWPQSYSTNWAGASAINDQAQVVDGLWQIVPGGVRPVQVGYDRLIAIGDLSWFHNYEVTVPITVHSFTPRSADDQGGVGIILRWQGHQGTGTLPFEWRDLGAYGYYSKTRSGLALRLDGRDPIVQPYTLAMNVTYIFKVRAETVKGEGRYSFKVWQQGQPEPDWNSSAFSSLVNVVDDGDDLLQGSMLLVAHRADATFGNVTINPISAPALELDHSVFLPHVQQ